MSYSVEIGFSPANELFISLYSFLCRKIHKRLEIGSDWVEVTKAQLPTAFAEKLERVDLQNFWHPVSILMLDSEHNHSATDFLRWFQEVSVGEIYERLVPYISTFTINVHEVRQQMLELLSEWNEHYFRHLDPHIIEKLSENQQKWSQTSFSNVVEFTGEVTNGCRFEEKEALQKVVLIPQYHYSPYNHVKHFGSSTLCMYAVDAASHDSEEPSAQINRFVRSIGDRNRIKIMRYLQKQPRTLIDIAAHIGLAKSTTHDHVTNLRTAGLAMSHTVGETATHYSFREESFRRLTEQLNSYINR